MATSGTEKRDWRVVLEEVRTSSGSRASLARKLNELEQAVQSEIERLEDARRRRVVGPRARTRAAAYTVEDSPRGPALTERRPGAEARPYKVPLPEYQAVAAAISASAEPRTFTAIKAAVTRDLGEELPDYAVRVPLRFWSAAGLLRHEGARFSRIGAKSEFARAVRRAWSSAKAEPVEVDPT